LQIKLAQNRNTAILKEADKFTGIAVHLGSMPTANEGETAISDHRLIEDYIPIEAISAEARREKSIRKGHISNLRLWWSDRPVVDEKSIHHATTSHDDGKPMPLYLCQSARSEVADRDSSMIQP